LAGTTIAVSTFFLLHYTLIPFILIRNTGRIAEIGGTVPDTGLRYPLAVLGGSSTILEISEAEILSGLQINLLSRYHTRDYHGTVRPIFQIIALTCIGFGIWTYRRLSAFRKQVNKSVLALSIGGHAPPIQSEMLIFQ
jgi:hypothetical protein